MIKDEMTKGAKAQSESESESESGVGAGVGGGEAMASDSRVSEAGAVSAVIVQRLDQSEGYPYTLRDYVRRFSWHVVWLLLIRWSPSRMYGWRRFWLRLFGAKLAGTSSFKPTTRIMHPWLLEMGEYSILSDGVVVYNLGPIKIGSHTSVSQDVYLCAGTHDHSIAYLPLRRPSVVIGSGVWVCAGAFIGPGVTVGDNCVVGARSVVNKDVPAGMIVGGNPAEVIKRRVMRQAIGIDGGGSGSDQGNRRLRVVHVTLTLSLHGGGVATYVWSLANRLSKLGVESVVSGLNDGSLDMARFPCEDLVTPVMGYALGPSALGVSRELWRQLDHQISEADVVHVHGMRTLLGKRARVLAMRYGKPLVISPHGQLDPWLLARKKKRKWVAEFFWERKNLQSATILHAVSVHEARQFHEYGVEQPIAVVPCGIDASSYLTEPDATVMGEVNSGLAGKRVLLFLSGLMPRKGVVELMTAWSRVHGDYPEWRLVIGGFDKDGYLPELRLCQQRLGLVGLVGLESSVVLVGEVDDVMKRRLLATADYLVLPTFSEAFGIIIGEALASKTPVITTTGAPWPEIRDYGCGWWIETGVEPLVAAMGEAMNQSDVDRQAMGEAGRRLIERYFTWEGVARSLREVYQSAVDGRVGNRSGDQVVDQSGDVDAHHWPGQVFTSSMDLPESTSTVMGIDAPIPQDSA